MRQQENHSKPDSEKTDGMYSSRARNYMKYSGMAFQMGGIILFGVWVGKKLDERFSTSTPWFTVGMALLSVFASLYIVLKDFLKKPS